MSKNCLCKVLLIKYVKHLEVDFAGAPRRKELWNFAEHAVHCASPASIAGCTTRTHIALNAFHYVRNLLSSHCEPHYILDLTGPL